MEINGKTPFEVFTGRKPTLIHLKVFGSRAVILKKGKNLSKFEAKGEELIFVGYSEEQKAYRLLDLKKKDIVKSRNVIFFEKQGNFVQFNLENKESEENNCESIPVENKNVFLKTKSPKGILKKNVKLLIKMNLSSRLTCVSHFPPFVLPSPRRAPLASSFIFGRC